MKGYNGWILSKCKFWWSYPVQIKVFDEDFFSDSFVPTGLDEEGR